MYPAKTKLVAGVLERARPTQKESKPRNCRFIRPFESAAAYQNVFFDKLQNGLSGDRPFSRVMLYYFRATLA